MPIQRFGSMLVTKGEFDGYLDLLQRRASRRQPRRRDVPQPDLGRLARLRLRLRLQPDARPAACATAGRERVHLSDLLDADLAGNPIRVAGHCYGCTAGPGLELRRRAEGGGGMSAVSPPPSPPARGAAAAGRICPARLSLFARGVRRGRRSSTADTLYVVGGLYGNLEALDAIERLARAGNGAGHDRLQRRLPLVRCRADWFAAIERGVDAASRVARQCRDRDRARRRISARAAAAPIRRA